MPEIAPAVRFGNTGIKISPIIVGCMSYGSKSWSEWVIEDKQRVFSILKHCYDKGLRTFDTADFYSNGKSERLLGEFLRHYNINRETVVILTKLYFPVDEDIEITHSNFADVASSLTLVNQKGLSRKHIIAGVKGSVERLGTYIDVLQIHRLDRETPMEEIMKALNDVVMDGYARYIGASSMLATEFAELQFIAEKHDWVKFVSSQSCYNLLYREDERELHPFARRHNVALIPWSPLARGVLSHPLDSRTKRTVSDGSIKKFGFADLEPHEREIVNRLQKVANDKNVPMATVGTAWVLHKGCYPIGGFSSEQRVDEGLNALDVKLTDEEMEYLEAPYRPRNVM